MKCDVVLATLSGCGSSALVEAAERLVRRHGIEDAEGRPTVAVLVRANKRIGPIVEALRGLVQSADAKRPLEMRGTGGARGAWRHVTHAPAATAGIDPIAVEVEQRAEGLELHLLQFGQGEGGGGERILVLGEHDGARVGAGAAPAATAAVAASSSPASGRPGTSKVRR